MFKILNPILITENEYLLIPIKYTSTQNNESYILPIIQPSDILYANYTPSINNLQEYEVYDYLSTPTFVETSNYLYPVSNYDGLQTTTIEDIFKLAGLTHVNGKRIKFGSPEIRTSNLGSSKSHHRYKGADGTANARDISIEGGDLTDYDDLKNLILNNNLIMAGLKAKGWGIINEVTGEILSKTGGTGKHFHLGPDKWATRTLNYWINNPSTSVTKYIKASKGTKLISRNK